MKKFLCLLTILTVLTGCASGQPKTTSVYYNQEYPTDFSAGTLFSEVTAKLKDVPRRKTPRMPEGQQNYVYFLKYGNLSITCDMSNNPKLIKDAEYMLLEGTSFDRLDAWDNLWSL